MYFFVFLFKISFSFKFNQLLPKVNPINYKHRWKPKPLTVFQALEKAIQTKIAQRCYERFIKDAKRIVTPATKKLLENKIKI